MTDKTLILDTPEQIEAYRLLSIRSALGLEVKTGMKFSNRVNVFKQAKDTLAAYGIKPKGTKRAVWEQFDALLTDLGLPESKANPL